jgi:hypothetical protein
VGMVLINTPSEPHYTFFERLWRLGGYPTNVDARIALANGSNTGQSLATAGDDALRVTYCPALQFGVQLTFRYEAKDIPMEILNLTASLYSSKTRVKKTRDPWSVAPGGCGDFIYRVWEYLPQSLKDQSYMSANGNHCFIPTISALDDTAATSLYDLPNVKTSNFDYCWASSANTPHCTISTDMKKFILDALTTNKYPGPTKQPIAPRFRWECEAEWNITTPTFAYILNDCAFGFDCSLNSPFPVFVPAKEMSAAQALLPVFFRKAEFWNPATRKKLGVIGGWLAWPCDQLVSYYEQAGTCVVAREWIVIGKRYWRLPPRLDPPGQRNLRVINGWQEHVVAWIKGSGEDKEIRLAPEESYVHTVAANWEGEIEFWLLAGGWHIGTISSQKPNKNVTVYGAVGKATLTDGPFIAIASM